MTGSHICQMEGCSRRANGNYTRKMYSASDGEKWPDDVSNRPVCWFHYVLDDVVQGGTAGALFGLFVATTGYVTGASGAWYAGIVAMMGGVMALIWAIRQIRKAWRVNP